MTVTIYFQLIWDIALNEIYAQQEIAYKAFFKQALDYGMQ